MRHERLEQDELPPSWNLDEIAEAAPPSSMGREGVFVLAWAIKEKNELRPYENKLFRFEGCLVMRILPEDDRLGGWHLTHLGRQANGNEGNWEELHSRVPPGGTHDIGFWVFHSKRFKNRPRNEDIYAALDSREEVRWTFEREPDWTLIDCGVCKRNWEKVVGEPPTRFFSKRAAAMLHGWWDVSERQ